MPSSLQDLFDPRELSQRYDAIPSIQDYLFTREFYEANLKGESTRFRSDKVGMISIGATQQPGPGNMRGQPARRLAAKGGTERYLHNLRYFTEMELPVDVLLALRHPENEQLQEKGREVVMIQMEEMRTKHRLFKEVCFSHILSYGVIDFDVNGNILVPSVNSSTGVVTRPSGSIFGSGTISRGEAGDYGVPDGNRGNIGSVIGALWSTASTDIGEQLDNLRRYAATLGAPRPTTIWMNSVKKQKLRDNTEFQTWAAGYPGRAEQVLNGEGFDGLWGFKWRFVDGTWTDHNGTTRDLIPQTSVIITPDMGPWIRAHEGAELIPNQMAVASTLEELLGQLDYAYGAFSYAMMSARPPFTMSQFFGDNFGLNFADPNAIFMPTVFA